MRSAERLFELDPDYFWAHTMYGICFARQVESMQCDSYSKCRFILSDFGRKSLLCSSFDRYMETGLTGAQLMGLREPKSTASRKYIELKCLQARTRRSHGN